jgi:hydrogenase maturation protease
MNIKLIAVGKVLMKDDGIGIETARQIEEGLMEKGIEVIYGETDFQYCFSSITEVDFIIVLDAFCSGKSPGEVTVKTLNEFRCRKKDYSQHSFSFLDLLKLYYPKIRGVIIGIEVREVDFGFGLSSELLEKLKNISEEVLNRIEDILSINKVYSNMKR